MFQLKTETREIGDHKFTFTQLTATEGRKVMLILARTLGPVLSTLGKGDLTEAVIGDALGGALSALDDASLKQLVDILAKSSRVETEDDKTPLVSQIYDMFFAGRMLLQIKWIGAALAFNFSDFFGAEVMAGLASAAAGLNLSK